MHLELARGLRVRPGGKAANEIRALWAWGTHKLGEDALITRQTMTADAPEMSPDPFQSMAMSTLKLVCAPWGPWLRAKTDRQ
jgi:hypothetical protein